MRWDNNDNRCSWLKILLPIRFTKGERYGGKKLREIKEDEDYQSWKRKYHKKCWNERNIYSNLYLKTLNIDGHSSKVEEFYRQKSCLN